MMWDNSAQENPLATAAGVREKTAGGFEIRPLAEMERMYIEMAVTLCGGNIPKAAALLQVSPSTIYRKKLHWERDGS